MHVSHLRYFFFCCSSNETSESESSDSDVVITLVEPGRINEQLIRYEYHF